MKKRVEYSHYIFYNGRIVPLNGSGGVCCDVNYNIQDIVYIEIRMDTVSIRALFTKEANIEADKLINAKTNILNQKGDNMRRLGNEAIQSLSTLTNSNFD